MPDTLVGLLEPTVSGLGYELLGIERGQAGNTPVVRLYIDQPSGITVEDCERVSRQVGDVLDVEQAVPGEYTLEVSSPGIERPLFTLEQHARYTGETVALRLRTLVEGRRRVRGVLQEIDAENLIVEADGQRFEIPFGAVERSRLVDSATIKPGAGITDRPR